MKVDKGAAADGACNEHHLSPRLLHRVCAHAPPAVSSITTIACLLSHVVRACSSPSQDAQRLFAFELNDVDMFDIDAAYEGAHAPASDVYAWERGGDW